MGPIKCIERKSQPIIFSGMFHWIPSVSIEECILSRKTADSVILNDHIVVCLFANPTSPMISLRNLIMPLRASNINYDQLKHVVILGNQVLFNYNI